jgi:hypothetical protein
MDDNYNFVQGNKKKNDVKKIFLNTDIKFSKSI